MKVNAEKLQILIGKQKMNYSELAQKSQLSRQTISCIKSGKSCNPITAYRIAEALQVQIEEIIE